MIILGCNKEGGFEDEAQSWNSKIISMLIARNRYNWQYSSVSGSRSEREK